MENDVQLTVLYVLRTGSSFASKGKGKGVRQGGRVRVRVRARVRARRALW